MKARSSRTHNDRASPQAKAIRQTLTENERSNRKLKALRFSLTEPRQQSDQSREQERRSAEETRINRDWTTRQRGDYRMDQDRMRQRQGRMVEDDDDHHTTGRNWRRDDDEMNRNRYGYAERNEGRYGENLRPRRRSQDLCGI
jgi:hypothetical protein